MSLNRREMLRLGAMGAAGAILSTAASSSVLPSCIRARRAWIRWRRCPLARATARADQPGGYRPAAVRQGEGRARFAPDRAA